MEEVNNVLNRISEIILYKLSDDNYQEEEKEVLLFGISRIVEDVPKTIGILILGFVLGILKEIAIVTLVIMTYKTFIGGVHAKTNLGCFVYSAMFYLITIYSAKYICFSDYNQFGVFTLMYIFAIYTIIVYAPADVPEIPKVNINLRKSLKIKSMIALNAIYIISIFLITDNQIKNLIIYSVFYISLMTTRSIYKLFRNKYGHECYVPEELI